MPTDLEQILAAICIMHAGIFDLARQDFHLMGFFGIAYARIGLSLLCLIGYLVGRSSRRERSAHHNIRRWCAERTLRV